MIKVSKESNPYNIYLNTDFNFLSEALKEVNINAEDKLFVITDDIVNSLYGEEIKAILRGYNNKVFAFNHGEENKTIETVTNIYSFLLENNADRSSVLIGFGGGIVGDLVGFVAATFMRGTRFVNIPTTIMSLVDSSVGGKVAYNYQNLKNLIGTFYNPILVYGNIEVLKTLPQKEIINGFAEVIKYGLIKEVELLDLIEVKLKDINNLHQETLLQIINTCISSKIEIVEKDFRDKDYRNILNFGHTIGHGIEVISNYEVAHGYAVALGMLVEIKLSEYVFNLNKGIYDKIETLLNKLGFPTKYKVDNLNMFMYAINHDKKSENNAINFVLIEEIGKPKTKVKVSKELIEKALKESIERR